MLKIIGCALVIITSTLIGFIYAQKFKNRTSQLTELHRSIYQLQNEIIYTHTPLPEAFYNISCKSLEPIGSIFREISKKLYTGQADSVFDAFKEVIDINKGSLYLLEEDYNILLSFARTLGESDLEGEKKMCLLTIENIKTQLSSASKIMDNNIKMYRALGFTIGVMVVIMFI